MDLIDAVIEVIEVEAEHDMEYTKEEMPLGDCELTTEDGIVPSIKYLTLTRNDGQVVRVTVQRVK